ncbi:hypothetical protein Tco_1514950 [Tanacetum coccineum]
MIPSIPISSSISPEGFLLLVLLLVVIIVTLVIVIVILIVVVDDVSLSFFHYQTFVYGYWFLVQNCVSLHALLTSGSWGYGMIYEDGDNDAIGGNDDERVISGNSSSGTKKYRGSNSNDGGNAGDEVKIAGGVIESGDEIEFSEELEEMLPTEARK